jgi:hypothetical protein
MTCEWLQDENWHYEQVILPAGNTVCNDNEGAVSATFHIRFMRRSDRAIFDQVLENRPIGKSVRLMNL